MVLGALKVPSLALTKEAGSKYERPDGPGVSPVVVLLELSSGTGVFVFMLLLTLRPDSGEGESLALLRFRLRAGSPLCLVHKYTMP